MARTWLLATIAMGMGCSGQPTSSSSSPSGPGPDDAAPAIDAQAALPPFDPEISKRWTWQECGTIASGPIVLRAKYAPDGKTVAIQFEDGSIVLKAPDRMATGVVLKASSGDFVFSRDGSRLAVLGKYPSIFQTSDGALVATMSGPAGQECGTSQIAVSENGDEVLQFGPAVGAAPLCVWHVADAKLTAVIAQVAGLPIFSAAFRSALGEATQVVVARQSRDGDVRIHDLGGQEISNVTLATASPEERVIGDSLERSLAVSPSGEAIVGWALSADKVTTVVWDSHDGHVLFRKEGANGTIAPAFSPDGGMIALDDGIFETVGFQRVGDGFSSRVRDPSLSPSGDSAAWAISGFAGIYDAKSKQTRLITATPHLVDLDGKPVTSTSYSVSSLDITKDGRALLVGTKTAVRWELFDRFADSEPTWVGGVPEGGIVHISPDGRFATTAGDGRLFFDLGTGDAVNFDLAPPPPDVDLLTGCVWLGLRFSPDSRWVAGSGYANAVEVFGTEEHKLLASLRSVGCNTKVVFSADNRFLYTARHEKFDTTDWHRVDTTFVDENLGPYDDVEISSQGSLATSVCKQASDGLSCVTNYLGEVPALTAPHPKISGEGNWIVAGGSLYHSPTGELRVFDPEARVALFTPNGDIVSARRDSSLALYCRSENP